MAIDKVLLDLLVCPETHEKLALAPSPLVEKLNAAIDAGTVKTRGGQVVKGRVDGGLVRPDNKYLYPIHDDIPVLFIEEAIPLEELG